MGDGTQLTGTVLKGKYRVEELLGRGGMGTVWAATHEHTGRKLAIKVLSKRFKDQKTIVERFGREARAASAVNHPGIVEVLDLDRSADGTPFLVMERLSGETLADMLDRRGRLLGEEVQSIVIQLLDALDAAHAHGVVHRDLKPENIIISRRRGGTESVKILDFGISAKEDEHISELTLEGSVLGTPHYMAPEQALGEARVDGRADLYSLGVLIYECLTGDVPFDAPNYNRLIHTILNDPPPSLPAGIAAPRALEELMAVMLKKAPGERPPTARDALSFLSGEAPLPAAALSPTAAGAGREFDGFPMETDGADPVFAGDGWDDTRGSRRGSDGPESSPEPAFGTGLEIDEDALARVTRPTHEDLHSMDGSMEEPSVRLTGPALATSAGRPTPTGSKPGIAPANNPKRRSGALLPLLGVLLASLGLAAWQGVLPGLSGGSSERSSVPSPQPASPSHPPSSRREAPAAQNEERAPTQTATVSVQVRNLPAGARLYLDGLPTGSPPLRMRRSEQERELRVEAPGYDARTIRIRPTRELRVNGSLRPSGRARLR